MALIMGLIVVVAILIYVFEMLRTQKLREKYAILWIIIGIGTLILCVFPQLLDRASSLLGIQVTGQPPLHHDSDSAGGSLPPSLTRTVPGRRRGAHPCRGSRHPPVRPPGPPGPGGSTPPASGD